ncbi:MAG: hypothetical protein ACKOZT_07450 [Cyanobium sp.]
MSDARGASRGIPTSRAYWDLQAEKVLNRIFQPAEMIELEALQPGHASTEEAAAACGPLPAGSAAPSSSAPLEGGAAEVPRGGVASQASQRQRRARRPHASGPAGVASAAEPAAPIAPAGTAARPGSHAWVGALPQPLLLVAVFAGAGLITATSGVLAVSQWNRFQESLQQERNLLLMERLRSFGPAAQPAPAPATPPAPTLSPAATAPLPSGGPLQEAGLPPPPPSEAWIQELATLPQGQRQPSLLRVPLSGSLGAAASPAPAASPPPRTPAGPVPLLVGVVAVPGKPGAAIFQMGGSTSTVSVGETIAGSSWRLIASNGDSVQIEHQGEVRRISIGGGG